MEDSPKTKITNMEHYELLKRIGLELKLLRVRAEMTQDDIVEKSNGELKKGTVIAIENAKYNASIRQVETYANLLGYRIEFHKIPAEN